MSSSYAVVSMCSGVPHRNLLRVCNLCLWGLGRAKKSRDHAFPCYGQHHAIVLYADMNGQRRCSTCRVLRTDP